MGAIPESSCKEAIEGISELSAGTESLSDWQLCPFFYSAVSPNSALAKADCLLDCCRKQFGSIPFVSVSLR